MGYRILLTGLALLILGGCQVPGSGQRCTAQIDWVDFVQVGSTQYLAGTRTAPTLQESDLGPVVATVKYRLSGNVCDPNYRPKDGDAAFLDPGTPIYQVRGYQISQLLAAQHEGRILAYMAQMQTAPSS
jgi:hypothetical protein